METSYLGVSTVANYEIKRLIRIILLIKFAHERKRKNIAHT